MAKQSRSKVVVLSKEKIRLAIKECEKEIDKINAKCSSLQDELLVQEARKSALTQSLASIFASEQEAFEKEEPFDERI